MWFVNTKSNRFSSGNQSLIINICKGYCQFIARINNKADWRISDNDVVNNRFRRHKG